MTDPVERVARTIFNHMFAEHERGKWDTDDWLRNRYLDCTSAAIAAMPAPWQPISTAPRDAEILVYCDGWIFVASWSKVDGCGRAGPGGHWMSNACVDGYTEGDPTHWMPLPEPPK